MEAGEGRQEGRVDVQDPAGECLDEDWCDDADETGEAPSSTLVFLQFLESDQGSN